MADDDIRRRIKRSQRQERDGMARVGGRRHGGSGNQTMRQADGRAAEDTDYPELHEFKRTDKKQITIKATDLERLVDQALVEGRVPVFRVELNGHHYVLTTEDDWQERGSRVV